MIGVFGNYYILQLQFVEWGKKVKKKYKIQNTKKVMYIAEDPEFVSSHRASIQADRYKPLQLSESIYFGSQEGIRRHPDLIRSIGINTFVGIDMTEQQAALLYNDPCISSLYPSRDSDILMVNFEPAGPEPYLSSTYSKEGAVAVDVEQDELIKVYHHNNTQLLEAIYQQLPTVQGDFKRFSDILSTQPHTNTFRAQDLMKFHIFNQLLDIIRLTHPESKIYIFSISLVNETMVSLLISHMLRYNPNIKIIDALQFVKNLAVELELNETPLRDEKVVWNGYLLQYYELSKRETVPWYQTGFSLYSNNDGGITPDTTNTNIVDDYNSFERSFSTNASDFSYGGDSCIKAATTNTPSSLSSSSSSSMVLCRSPMMSTRSLGDMSGSSSYRMKRSMGQACSREYEYSGTYCPYGLMGSDQMVELARCKRARSD